MHPAETPLQILEFFEAVGLETILEDTPQNRFGAPPLPPPPAVGTPLPAPAMRPGNLPVSPSTAGTSRGEATPLAPQDAVQAARALAKTAPDLATLEALMRGFEGCALKSTATQLVFGEGSPGAAVMVIGEAPGRDEDAQGKPFVGKAGQLLDKMLAAIGLDRSRVYLTHIVPWRPPGNRTPTLPEMAICAPFLERQIALCAPKVLLTMGGTATQSLLHQKEGILRLRGRWFEASVGGRVLPALATLHPEYLLSQPTQKALAWRDLQALRARLLSLD